jgi:hypothetical protein
MLQHRVCLSADRVGRLELVRHLPAVRSAALAALVAAVVAALMIPGFRAPGPEMDEGFIPAYAVRVLDGAVPHRDFESFYGPGGPWLVAGAFDVFGPSLETERAVGLLYRLLLVVGACGLAAMWGRVTAAAAGLLTGGYLLGLGLSAVALIGALGLALIGLALAVRAALCTRSPRGAALLAGVSSGLALLLRPDLAFPVLAGALALAAAAGPTARRRWLLGLGLGVVAYIPHAIIVGPHRIARLLSDLVAAEPGRGHPVPGLTDDYGQLLAMSCMSAAAFVLSGVLLKTRRRADRRPGLDPPHTAGPDPHALLATGLFCGALLPYAFSQPDKGHIVPIAAIALGLTPILATSVLGALRPAWPALARQVAGALCLGVLALLLAPGVLRSGLRDQVRALADGRPSQPGYPIRRKDRVFRVASATEARDAQAMVDAVERLNPPRRTLFVGPGDLRRTNYNDAFLYYLLDDLRPASYYMELNPQTANRRGSGLARDLSHADVLVLNRRWDHWRGPPAAQKLGPDGPNQVVRSRFCLRTSAGTYELLQRCRVTRS